MSNQDFISDEDWEKSPGFIPDEQFQAMQAAPASDIPLPAGTGGLAPPSSAIVQEPSDLISWQDRMKVKNLGTPKASLSYLKKQYPNLDIQSTSSGQIIFKEPGERNYKPLDLDLGEGGITEVAQDVGDVLFDIPAGAAQTAAQTAAAIGGGAATGGVGALPASMAAGAGSSAAIEAARQKLGELAGIEDNISGEDIKSSAMWGGALPLGLGSGATKQAIQKFSPQMKEELAQKILEKGRGGLGRAYDATKDASRSFMSAASGIPKSVMEYYVKNKNFVDEIGKDTKAQFDIMVDFQNDLSKALKRSERASGEKVGKAMESAKTPANISGAKAAIDKEIKRVEGLSEKGPGAIGDYLDDLKSIKENFFSKEGKDIGEELPASVAFETQKLMGDDAGFQQGFSLNNKPIKTKQAQAFIKQMYGEMGEALDKATGGASTEAKKELSRKKALAGLLGSDVKSPLTLNQALMSGDSGNRKFKKQALKELAEGTGIPLSDQADKMQALAYLGNPQWLPFSSQGTTSTTKSISLPSILTGLGALGASKTLGGPGSAYLGGMAGFGLGTAASSPKAVRAILRGQGISDAARKKAAPYSLGVGNLWEEMSKKEGEE